MVFAHPLNQSSLIHPINPLKYYHPRSRSKGSNMREAVYINLGLLALKKVIESLNNGAHYVPYQVIGSIAVA